VLLWATGARARLAGGILTPRHAGDTRHPCVGGALTAILAMTACSEAPSPSDAIVRDAPDARDAADVWPEGAVCEGERLDDQTIACRRANIPRGLLCTRDGCPGEDGGADLSGCCALLSS